MKTWAFFFILSFSFLAKAEYRAFLLKLSKSEQDFRLVKSNLDPEQYARYYPIRQGEKISYIDTWMCKGETQNKAICKSPRERLPAARPAPNALPIDQIPPLPASK